MNSIHPLRLGLLVPLLWCGVACSPQVTPGPLPQGVVALGRLEPASGVLSIGGMIGDRVEKLEENYEKVFERDDVLGQLASWTDRDQEVALAQKQLAEAQKRYEAIKAQGDSQIAEAEKKLLQLNQQKEPDLAGQEKLLSLITKRKEQADRTVRDVETSGFNRLQIEQQRAIAHTLELEQASAQLQLEKARQTYDFNIALGEMAVKTAKATLTRYLSEVPIDTLTETVKAAEKKREHSLLKAPSQGRILKVLTRAGEPVSTMPVLRFGNTKEMIAIAEVYETDVPRIKLDQKVYVRFQESPPDNPPEFQGTVSQIGRLVSSGTILDLNPAAPSDRRVIEVRVKLDPSSPYDPSHYVLRQVRVEFQGQP